MVCGVWCMFGKSVLSCEFCTTVCMDFKIQTELYLGVCKIFKFWFKYFIVYKYMDNDRILIFAAIINDMINNDFSLSAQPQFNPNVSQMVLQNSLYDRNPIRHVVADKVKTSLKSIKFCDAVDKENHNKCLILFDPFQEDDDIIQLPCNHCFFVEPIMKWLTEDSCECPVCRYKFDSMEKNLRIEGEVVEGEVVEGGVVEGEVVGEDDALLQQERDDLINFQNFIFNINNSHINNVFFSADNNIFDYIDNNDDIELD